MSLHQDNLFVKGFADSSTKKFLLQFTLEQGKKPISTIK